MTEARAPHPAVFVGARIRVLREQAGLTQQALADGLGITQTAVSYWEHGRRQLDCADLCRVAGALGVSAVTLLPDGGPVETPAASPDTLASKLLATTTHLERHIEQRAQQLAAPRLEAAEQRINEMRTECAREVQRAEDLIAEFRRQVTALERQVAREKERADRSEALLVQAEAYVHEMQGVPEGGF